MVKQVTYFVLIAFIITNVTTLPEQLEPEDKPTLGPTARTCADASGMTAEQIQLAQEEKDTNRISACFFTCFLNSSGLIIEDSGKKTLDVLAILIFAKMYIPTMTIMNTFSIAAEVIACATEYENEAQVDDPPYCPKTKVFVKCLVEHNTLVEALWIATQS